MLMITILAPEEDGDAILQLLGDDPRFVVMSAIVGLETQVETKTETRHFGDVQRRIGVHRDLAERELGQALISFARANNGRMTRDQAIDIAVKLGYRENSGATYLTGMARDGVFEVHGGRRNPDRIFELREIS